MSGVVLEISEEDVFQTANKSGSLFPTVPDSPENKFGRLSSLPRPPIPESQVARESLTKTDLDRLAAESAGTEIEIIDAYPVALRYIKGCEDKCVMCLQPLMRICMKCDSKESDFTQCSVVVGKCGHAIHQHCLSRYLESQTWVKTCLICRQPWELESRWMLASDYCD